MATEENADVDARKRGYVRYPLMSNNKLDRWDPSCLRLAPADAAGPQLETRRGRRASSGRGRFIAGPIDVAWLSRARKLGVTALWVGLGLWYLRGLKTRQLLHRLQSHDAGLERLARCEKPGSEGARKSRTHSHRAAGEAKPSRITRLWVERQNALLKSTRRRRASRPSEKAPREEKRYLLEHHPGRAAPRCPDI